MKTPRMLVSGLLAVAVTFSLFYLMVTLVFSNINRNIDSENLPGIHFGPVDIPEDAASKERRKPPPPPPPKEPPPPPKMQVQQATVEPTTLNLNIPKLDVPLVGGGDMFLGNFAAIDRNAEGDVIPLVRIQPQYPRDAKMKGTEGWVKIEFTVTPVGTVTKPRVIDSKPPRIFNREAIRAILKWKFKPQVIDGQAVERLVTQTIHFNLNE